MGLGSSTGTGWWDIVVKLDVEFIVVSLTDANQTVHIITLLY